MDKNDFGLWLQYLGGALHIAALLVGWIGFHRADAVADYVATGFAVVWFMASAYLVTRAGQHYEA